ncbi:Com2p Ecym_8403 [Eremothecium cymbalariae DBVPG|uniref:C2H2-type domain-containing protein n=1 Tax=Eremothecium cymbalariae (strain CBS 270.75 / DBVPG 7215 / KCTC 17166 / NRRL Y-17582) TaxID=931890 RepID=G8JXU9_ERECY|nr:Hypothetical protein Ecym_8403 [Eremothecium cymbalariae DBVPG\
MSLYQQPVMNVTNEATMHYGHNINGAGPGYLYLQDDRFNFQIHQKGIDDSEKIRNDLTGNTLNTTASELSTSQMSSITASITTVGDMMKQGDGSSLDIDLIEEYLNLESPQQSRHQQSTIQSQTIVKSPSQQSNIQLQQEEELEQLNFFPQQQYQQQYQQQQQQDYLHSSNVYLHSHQPHRYLDQQQQDRQEELQKHQLREQPQWFQPHTEENYYGEQLQRLSFSSNNRRLSISSYHSDKPVYYEYEDFGMRSEEDEEDGLRNDDDDIVTTDVERLYHLSHLMLSPGRKLRKDSIFSDYGNDMAMPLPNAQMNLQIEEEYTTFADSESIPQWRRMKERLKWNIFGNKSEPALSSSEYTSMDDTEPQPLLRKKYFWSRKPTIPVIHIDSQNMNTDVGSHEEASIDPSELLRPGAADFSFNLECVSPPSEYTSNTMVNSSNTSTIGNVQDFSNSLEQEMNNCYLHQSPVKTTEIIPTITPSKDSTLAELSVARKKLGLPKTRGRKPSPALDATKPFGCEFCERRFKRQEHLKRHVRSLHMGEKPYGCDICGKKFSRSDNLNQHIKTHTNGNFDDN